MDKLECFQGYLEISITPIPDPDAPGLAEGQVIERRAAHLHDPQRKGRKRYPLLAIKILQERPAYAACWSEDPRGRS